VGGWVDLSSSAAGTTLILSVPLETQDTPPPKMSEITPNTRQNKDDPTVWGWL
jgi:hypothetical protein